LKKVEVGQVKEKKGKLMPKLSVYLFFFNLSDFNHPLPTMDEWQRRSYTAFCLWYIPLPVAPRFLLPSIFWHCLSIFSSAFRSILYLIQTLLLRISFILVLFQSGIKVYITHTHTNTHKHRKPKKQSYSNAGYPSNLEIF